MEFGNYHHQALKKIAATSKRNIVALHHKQCVSANQVPHFEWLFLEWAKSGRLVREFFFIDGKACQGV